MSYISFFYMDGNTMYQVLYCCFILMGVNSDGLCVIPSNVTDWRDSCVIILGIWNDALVSVLVLVSGVPLLCDPLLLPQVRYPLVWGVGVGNVF